MIVLLRPDASPSDREHVLAALRGLGYPVTEAERAGRTVLEAPSGADAGRCRIECLAGVERIFTGEPPAHLVTRELQPRNTVVRVGAAEFGGSETVPMGGPCAVESREALLDTARAVAAAGAKVLRGGAFKPRTSPYAFQGLGREGLELLAEARAETGLPVVTEVLDTRDVELVAEYADMLQVGSRNMHNFALLQEVGRARKPVLLKRGMSATIDEFLTAAEYVLAGGNDQVVPFERASRNTLDLTAVPLLAERTHLPVVVDPSHASGRRSLVLPLARAAAAAGAHGVLVDVHVRPHEALCDGWQALLPEEFAQLVRSLRAIDEALAGCDEDVPEPRSEALS